MKNLSEKIEGYLLGELEGAELIEFEQALQSDAPLAQSVAQHREMMQRLDAMRLRKKVKVALQPPPAQSVSMFGHRYLWAMAASLVLLAAAFWFFTQPEEKPSNMAENPPLITPTEIPQKPEEKSPVLEAPAPKKEKPAPWPVLAREFHDRSAQTLMRDADPHGSPQTPVQLAAKAFDNRNYKLAADILTPEALVQQDDAARFLRADARFELGQFARAAGDYEILKGSFEFKHEARWNFLLCQLALGKTRQAQTLLNEMAAEPDFPFRTKALKLKARLTAY